MTGGGRRLWVPLSRKVSRFTYMKKSQSVKLLIFVAILLILSFAAGWVYLQNPKFGPEIDTHAFEDEQESPRFVNGQFRNLEPTEVLVGDKGTGSIIMKGLFRRPENLRPDARIPTRKTDLESLDRQRDFVIWLGHSSFYVQLGGRRILVDPVFSESAAPVSFANKAFAGTRIYSVDDLPDIDYLLITHDHWDHLDYPTVSGLRDKVRHVVCGLGVDQYFVHWGYARKDVHAADWFTALTLDSGFTIHILPARHYSGRLMSKNQTLWAAFALETPGRRIFFGGDSGYGEHVARIGERFEDFDLAVLDMGQYDERWPYIHMTPEQAAKTAEELRARVLLPAHVGKFSIAAHAWNEPFERIARASAGKNYRLTTPMIGELMYLAGGKQDFGPWWRIAATTQ